MKKLLGISGSFILVLAAITPVSRAQDFFRDFGTSRSSGGIGPITPSEYSYQDSSSPSGMRQLLPEQELALPDAMEDADRYNFAIGAFRFGIAAGIGIEWNDNITLSEHNRKSDFIFRPVL